MINITHEVIYSMVITAMDLREAVNIPYEDSYPIDNKCIFINLGRACGHSTAAFKLFHQLKNTLLLVDQSIFDSYYSKTYLLNYINTSNINRIVLTSGKSNLKDSFLMKNEDSKFIDWVIIDRKNLYDGKYFEIEDFHNKFLRTKNFKGFVILG